jgi:hypothetical protein
MWLEFTDGRKIEIVDPLRIAVPTDLLHLAPQVTLHKVGASNFLSHFSPSPLSAEEKTMHAVFQRVRLATAQAQAQAAEQAYPPVPSSDAP